MRCLDHALNFFAGCVLLFFLLLMHQENASGHCCLCGMLRKAINRNSRIFVAVGCK